MIGGVSKKLTDATNPAGLVDRFDEASVQQTIAASMVVMPCRAGIPTM